MSPGIHLFHKPVGPTSFSIVRRCIAEAEAAAPGRTRPALCHGGTLDPFASGLLLILVEPATRLFDHLHNIPKTYHAVVRWGIETDNGDPGGKVLREADPVSLDPRRLDETLRTFLGWHDQIPHPTSARRIDGQRAYVRAQRGEDVVMPPSRVYLHEARWVSHDLPRFSHLRLTARGGYYVRALARDLGRALGCGAHLRALHREAIGPWQDPGEGGRAEVHGRDALPWLARRDLTDMEIGTLRRNEPIPAGEIHSPDWPLPPAFADAGSPVRGFHLGKFVSLLTRADDRLTRAAELRGGV